MKSRAHAITRRHFVQASAAAGAAIAASGTRLPRAWAAGDTLKVRNYSDIQVLDPGFLLSAPDGDVMRCIFPSLVEYKIGNTWGWQKKDAASIEQVDDTHINFTLNPNLGWNNGFGPVTAEDVKYSFERIADPKMQSPYAQDWSALDHVEVKDDRSGTIVMKQAYAPLWTTTLPGTSGLIICKKAVEALKGKKFTTQPPAVAGPYEISNWTPAQKLTLTRMAGYKAGPMPAFATIEVYPIDDEKTAEVGFLSGDIDFTTVPIDSLKELESKPPKDSKLIKDPSLKYVWIGINKDNPQFTDIRVRQAVQYAVNVDDILQAAYFGEAAPATGIIPPGLIGHRAKSLIPVKGDPEKARQLLKDAGFPNGFKCRMDLLNKSTYLAAAQVIQANLSDVGIQVDINGHDSGVWWTMGDQSHGNDWKKLQIMYNRFSSEPDPAWYTEWFTTAQVGVWNWERFSNKEFDKLNKEAAVTMDPAKRGPMYVKMQDLMEESGCYRFVTHELTPSIYRTTVLVPALLPDGTMIWSKFKTA